MVYTSGTVSVASSCGPSLSINDVSVTEGDTGSVNANFTVNLSPAATGTVTVAYATAAGTATAGSDFTTATGTLTFLAGETTKTFSVAVLGDTLVEGNETFNVNLSGATGGAAIADAQGVGTIVDNEVPATGITATPSCVVSTGARTVSVSVSGGPGNNNDWVGLYPTGSSTYTDWWYLNGTKTAPATGLTSASFNVTLPAGVAGYTLKLIRGGVESVVYTSGTVSVANSCGPSLSINDVSVTEGDTGSVNANFTVSLSPAATGTVTVAYATAAGTATAGSDFTTATGTLTFLAGETARRSASRCSATRWWRDRDVQREPQRRNGRCRDRRCPGCRHDRGQRGARQGITATPSCVVSTGARTVASPSAADRGAWNDGSASTSRAVRHTATGGT